MVKYYNNPSGKSDKQQEHFRKQGQQDVQRIPTLERWFERITTPAKPRVRNKALKYADGRNKCNGGPGRIDMRARIHGGNGWGKGVVSRASRPGRDPIKVAAKRERDIIRIETWRMMAEDKNIK